MADFCRGCVDELFGSQVADRNDMVRPGLADDEFVQDLCEGCGYGHFDRKGQRVHSPHADTDPETVKWSAESGRWVPK